MSGRLLQLIARAGRSSGLCEAALVDARLSSSVGWTPMQQRRHATTDDGSSQPAVAPAAAATESPPAAEDAAATESPPAAKDAAAAIAPKPKASKQPKQAKSASAAAKPAAAAASKAGSSQAAGATPASAKPKPKPKQKDPKQKAKQTAGAAAVGPTSAKAKDSHDAEAPASQPSQRPLLVARLLDVPQLSYFDVPAGILPEATAEYYKDPILKGDNVHEPNYGCKAVQAEWEFSGQRSLMARECMHKLARRVQDNPRRHLYLDGWTGSGKSVALYSLVAWARAQGWLALYIPSAFSLVQTGTFTRGEDGLWDTPEAARWILTSLLDSHAAQLADLKTASGQPLSSLVEEGLDKAAKPSAVVAAAIAAKEAVAGVKEVPTLIAVDDYNVLYSHTGYYESVHNFHRRQLAPDELRLVQAFRVLEQPPPANGVAVAAPTFGGTITSRLRLPRPKATGFHMPRYTLPEVAAAADYFIDSVIQEGETPNDDALLRALFLTNGNAKELRECSPAFFLGEDPLGISLGYKAAATRLRAHDAGELL
ncbi:hypothetical protein D9Q98_007321 [Chlorella vulgaris]|uniref:Small ribosomal subunit protein mS29 n=1 Tax=Chlorella vulgaris TaxID=3077 RepID=A0A9D4TLB6_CHLVU|nr:hypothetical protein D9Q98_007321 [Chlorella vulgaris]